MILKVPKDFIENIVAPACFNDENIIQAFKETPRALFIDEAMKFKAYDDKALPIGLGQTISQVTTVAKMLHMLEIDKKDTILEIGSGSGFVTCLLSHLAKYVYAVELLPTLAEKSRKVITSLRRINIIMKVGDGNHGWVEYAPYDKIIASAGAKNLPPKLVEQLKDGGIIVIPVNNHLMKYKKINGKLMEEKGSPCSFVDFVGS